MALAQTRTVYPRAIVLHYSGSSKGDIIADVASSPPGAAQVGAIYESTDQGADFTRVGQIADPAAASGLCCTTVWEVPRQLGDLAPGTLLWAGTFGNKATVRSMSIRVWDSTDAGRNWTYLSTAYHSPNTKGIWEPSFEVDAAGQLVMQFSDETQQPVYSQFLTETRSLDGGRTWRKPVPTVRSSDPGYRPGMATVQRLPNRTYVMTYEVCGVEGQYGCAVHLRTSADGWSWGNPNDMGTRPTDTDGEYFAHTPTIAWSPAGGPDGSLLLIGQVLDSATGVAAAGNGDTYFVNSHNGQGVWQAEQAPVPVSDATDSTCPNYSPTLAPYENGSRVLEITTDSHNNGPCLAYFASSTIQTR